MSDELLYFQKIKEIIGKEIFPLTNLKGNLNLKKFISPESMDIWSKIIYTFYLFRR